MARPPVTLLRHVTWELLKLLVTTTGVLVAVISFAAMVKPLADGKLQPGDALKFMMYAMPPMLAYALPFAACFAATLVYHRLATDNEAHAAAAGGVSHRTLLLPAAALGIALAVLLGLLNEQIIPRFLQSMQRLITADVVRLLASAAQRGEGLAIGPNLRHWVYADNAVAIPPPEGTSAVAAMALQRPVLIELDEHGHPRREGAAESAYVLLHDAPRAGLEGKPRLMVSIRLKNVRGRDPVQGIFSNELSPVLTLEIPDAFQDDPKFLTFGQLSLLREHPERMNWIESQRRELSIEIARSIVVDDLAGSIASRGTFVLHDPEGRTLTVSCAGISAIPASPGHFALLLPNGRNEIEVHRTALAVPSRGSGSDVRLFASGATLAPALIDEMGVASVQFRLDLSTVRSVTQDGDAGGVLGQVALGGLLPAQSPLDQFRESPVAKLVPEALRLARERPQSSDAVVRIAAHLDADVADLGREITSKRHERLALAACCLIMVITGSVTALKFSLRLPLTVYLWSFFPALLGIITIAGGQQLTHGKGEWGLVLLWGGVAGLLAYTLVAYRGVARH